MGASTPQGPQDRQVVVDDVDRVVRHQFVIEELAELAAVAAGVADPPSGAAESGGQCALCEALQVDHRVEPQLA